jgi:calcium/calmodulin-dependent protein kinase kinase 2
LGITLYSFVYGDIPWSNCNSIPVLYEQIKNNEITFPTTIKTSDELKDLIGAMLIKNPENRINLDQLKEHTWITKNGTYPMPCQDKCQCLVEISEEDINSVVKSIPKLDTLILIKKMLKNHSFQNPFLTSAIGTSTSMAKSLASRLAKLERFQSSRSNSAPGNYQTLSPACAESQSESPVD